MDQTTYDPCDAKAAWQQQRDLLFSIGCAILAAQDTNPGPSRPELRKIAALVDTPPEIRAESLLELPAPAALASLGLVNSLTFVLNILSDPAGKQKTIPYYYGMAAAWHQVGKLLSAPDLNTGPAASGADWPPPWLHFLKEVDF